MWNPSNRVVPDVSGGVPSRAPTDRPTSPPTVRGGRWPLSPQRSKRKKVVKEASMHSPRGILKSLRQVALLNPSPRGAEPSDKKGAATSAYRNLTQFLTIDCPTDVLPKILAYAGPSTTAALQQTSRHFRNVLNREGTWRGLCEELYKWKTGDAEPSSWKEYYRLHPCVPVDFASVTSALAMAGAGWTKKQVKKRLQTTGLKQGKTNFSALEIPQTITVLVRPGRYEVAEAITISTLRRTTQVRIKRMEIPASVEPPKHADDSNKDEEDEDTLYCRNDVILESKTRRRNEPLIRIFRGQLVMDGVTLEHYSPGIDIWNGNAAIQIQPSSDSPMSFLLPSLPEASAVLNRVAVRSSSGRGIVAVDGGHLFMEDSYVHHSAATGVYVGGQGSRAVLRSTDVVYNGLGNQRAGGIARGHSGVYVEQGKVELENCSVSSNTAAGISVIARENIALRMTNSDVLSNGCTPVELPVPTNPSLNDNSNRVAVIGTPKPRSIILRSALQEKKALHRADSME